MSFAVLPVLGIGILMNIISSHGVYYYAMLTMDEPFDPLPDVIHSLTPKIKTYIPDYFLWISIIYALFGYNDDYVNLDENSWVLAKCIIVRSFSVFLTPMPTCMPVAEKNPTTYYEYFFHSTHDLMFSGHTLCFIFLGNITNTPSINYIGPSLLVLSRQHYTIDVIVAGLVYSYLN
jgi:hypothetical protein